MKNESEYELNQKIIDLMAGLGFSSSKFADFIGVSRPVISHIVAKRNNPSLEIVQKIALKLPELGLDWTFPGRDLDIFLLNKIADRLEAEDIFSSSSNKTDSESTTKDLESKVKSIVRVVVYYSDNTYTEIPSSMTPI